MWAVFKEETQVQGTLSLDSTTLGPSSPVSAASLLKHWQQGAAIGRDFSSGDSETAWQNDVPIRSYESYGVSILTSFGN